MMHLLASKCIISWPVTLDLKRNDPAVLPHHRKQKLHQDCLTTASKNPTKIACTGGSPLSRCATAPRARFGNALREAQEKQFTSPEHEKGSVGRDSPGQYGMLDPCIGIERCMCSPGSWRVLLVP